MRKRIRVAYSVRLLASRQILGAILALALCAGCSSLDRVATSHIEANNPSPASFDEFLERDLAKYFLAQGIEVASVKHEMLRDGPTQSGVGYPKFYAWVRIIEKGGATREGAVRLAAVDRNRFEVTDYLAREAIVSDPASIESVFPQAVVQKIREKLR